MTQPNSIIWWNNPDGTYRVGSNGVLGMPHGDGFTDGFNTIQGARSYDGQSGTWTTPDAYAGEVDDPMSQKSYVWNRDNAVAYGDPSGYDSQNTQSLTWDAGSDNSRSRQDVEDDTIEAVDVNGNVIGSTQITVPSDIVGAIMWAAQHSTTFASELVALTIMGDGSSAVDVVHGSKTAQEMGLGKGNGQPVFSETAWFANPLTNKLVGDIVITLASDVSTTGFEIAQILGREFKHALDALANPNQAHDEQNTLCKCPPGGNLYEAHAYFVEDTILDEIKGKP